MSNVALTLISKTTSEGQIFKKAVLAIDLLKTSRYQTRDTAFNDLEELENLANSIKAVGLLEPPRVRRDPQDPGCFEIISGHRRILAVSKFLGWKEVECEIFENLGEFDVFRLNVTENMQRSNLSPYEEGISFLTCERLFGFSDEEIGNRLHKSRQMIQSRKELAVAANHYLKHANSSIANAFLRHFSSGHKEILNKLEDNRIIGNCVAMIARGGSTRHLRRFIDLFANENSNQDTAVDFQPNRIHHHLNHAPKVDSSVKGVLSLFEELKAEVSEKCASEIMCFEEKYLKTHLKEDYQLSSRSNIFETRTFRCPSCQESYDLSRKLRPDEDKVIIIIAPKDKHDDTEKAVFSFPAFYKVKVNS
jgi:ParB/RepB/Spo0J family partition protein